MQVVAHITGVGAVRIWQESGSGGRFCVGAFGINLVSVTMKMFSYLIYFIKKFYKFCTFNVICKDNVAINYIIVQHKKNSFPSTLMGHTMLVCL
jgi:hypothetical protein